MIFIKWVINDHFYFMHYGHIDEFALDEGSIQPHLNMIYTRIFIFIFELNIYIYIVKFNKFQI